MSTGFAAALSVLSVLVILAVVHVPLGSWIHRVFTSPRHLRIEVGIYRLAGVNPEVEQRWSVYLISVLGFSVVSIGFLWLLIAVQGVLPLSLGRSMNLDTAFNTAVSFVTNTNWQSYAGETGAGYRPRAGEPHRNVRWTRTTSSVIVGPLASKGPIGGPRGRIRGWRSSCSE